MFGRETRMLLRHYLEQGTSKSALARKLGVHRDTIHRWIRDGELDRDLDGEPVRYGPRRPVATKLDAYKAIVEARLAAYPQLSAVRLLDEIRAAGYSTLLRVLWTWQRCTSAASPKTARTALRSAFEPSRMTRRLRSVRRPWLWRLARRS
jgi:transposase-like protein